LPRTRPSHPRDEPPPRSELERRASLYADAAGSFERRGLLMKGAQKPKKLAKKAPQKTLKERRSEKQAKKRTGGGI